MASASWAQLKPGRDRQTTAVLERTIELFTIKIAISHFSLRPRDVSVFALTH